jgi:four helix bundle protein
MREGETERGGEGGDIRTRKVIRRHTELEVFQRSFNAAMDLFWLSKKFPIEERYSLTDQVRRSSRSVASNITEAWRKRRYPASFVAKLSDAEGEAAETQTWIKFAESCEYIPNEEASKLLSEYDAIIGKLVNMIQHPDHWKL